MRRLFAALALAALGAACSDQATAPIPADSPQLSTYFGGPGGWVIRNSADAQVCQWWDGDGNLVAPVPCTFRFTKSANYNGGFRATYDGQVPNSTGRAVHFGPYDYPQLQADYMKENYGLEGPPLPLCDWFRPPPGYLQCTLNWHMVVSASGRMSIEANYNDGPLGL
jgi:hypothetical protein